MGYKFNIIDINRDEEKIQKAELHLFKENRPSQKTPHTSLVQIDIINNRNDRVISSRILSVAVHGWITFPVTKTIRRWVRKRKINKGIRISVKSLYGAEKNVKISTKNHFRREPMLVVFTKRIKGSSLAALLEDSTDNNNKLDTTSSSSSSTTNNEKKRRQKRQLSSASNDNENEEQSSGEMTYINSLEKRKMRKEEKKEDCQLKDLIINTEQFGLKDRFLSPQFINIHQCVGSCGYKKVPTYEQTNHGIFQAMASIGHDRSQRGKTLPDEPCCAPSEFKDQLMIAAVRNEHTHIIKFVTLDKLIATKCGCL